MKDHIPYDEFVKLLADRSYEGVKQRDILRRYLSCTSCNRYSKPELMLSLRASPVNPIVEGPFANWGIPGIHICDECLGTSELLTPKQVAEMTTALASPHRLEG